jgi:hypothetical protein
MRPVKSMTWVPFTSFSSSSLFRNSCVHGKEHSAFLAILYLVSEPSGSFSRTLSICSQTLPLDFTFFT